MTRAILSSPPQAGTAADLSRPVRVIPSATSVRDAYDLLNGQAELVALPVLEDGVLVGMINRDSFMRSMARPYHAEIFGKKSCTKLMDPEPLVVQSTTSIQDLACLLDEGSAGKSMADSFAILHDGRVAGAGLARDVFAALMHLERAAAEELRRHRDHLEDLVRERTADLAKAEAHARLILDSSADGLYGLDCDGRVSFINAAACRILGHAPEQLIGRHIHGQFHCAPAMAAAGPAEECAACRSLREGTVVIAQDDSYRHAEGRAIPVLYSTHPIRRDEERIGTVVSFVDMSEREKLEAQRSLLAAIVDSSQDAIVGHTLGGVITTWNQGAVRLYGHEPGEALGRNLNDLIPPEQMVLEARQMAHMISGEPVQPFETVRLRKDGRRVPVMVSLSPIRDRHGRIAGASKIVRDITRQKEAESARERALAEAERLARIRSEFLANMSHEIRTPLNGVLGMAQIGLRDGTGNKAGECFRRILDSGQLLLGIINDILDFSKIEAGRMGIEQLPVHIGQLLNQTADLHRDKAGAKRIGLYVDSLPSLPQRCLSDPLRLAQVLNNLLSNAVKFTDQGEVRLQGELRGTSLLLRVSDTGTGIEPEHLERIFRAFEQADGSTTRRFGGTGLGLAITQNIVALMGGNIWVNSVPGQGSVFEVELPYLPVPELTGLAADSAIILRSDTAGEERLAGIRVLVAEDNEINRMVLDEMLSREGALVTLAEDGVGAMDMLAFHGPESFDIVLMDVQMPGMDGLETTRRILDLAPGMPVVGQTAHAMAEERRKCLAAGMVEQITKPIEEQALVDAILRHHRKAWRPTAQGHAGLRPVTFLGAGAGAGAGSPLP